MWGWTWFDGAGTAVGLDDPKGLLQSWGLSPAPGTATALSQTPHGLLELQRSRATLPMDALGEQQPTNTNS